MIAVSLHSSKTIQASSAEQSLIWSISKVLTNTIPCKANLKPSSGGISATNGKGTVSTLIQGLGDPNVEDTTLVKVGGFKNTLEVVKMDFTGSGTGNPKTSTVIRDFIVYYKKKGVGTMEDKPCNSSNVEGCYFQGCSLKYKLENNASPNVEVCDVQNCAGLGENHIAGISCGSGKYLKGFDSNGNKICQDLGECATNEYLKGFDSNGNKICLNRSTLIGSQICPSGQYLGGFNSSGIKTCHPVPPGPPGPRGPAGSGTVVSLPSTSSSTTGSSSGSTTGSIIYKPRPPRRPQPKKEYITHTFTRENLGSHRFCGEGENVGGLHTHKWQKTCTCQVEKGTPIGPYFTGSKCQHRTINCGPATGDKGHSHSKTYNGKPIFCGAPVGYGDSPAH